MGRRFDLTGNLGALLIGLGFALTVTACGAGHASAPTGEPLASTSADYGRDYSKVTCQQFLRDLTPGQRTAAAYLALARLRSDDHLPTPSDVQVDEFEAGITGSCEAAPDNTLVRAAVLTYQH